MIENTVFTVNRLEWILVRHTSQLPYDVTKEAKINDGHDALMESLGVVDHIFIDLSHWIRFFGWCTHCTFWFYWNGLFFSYSYSSSITSLITLVSASLLFRSLGDWCDSGPSDVTFYSSDLPRSNETARFNLGFGLILPVFGLYFCILSFSTN